MKFYFLFTFLLVQLTAYTQLETKNWFLCNNRVAITPTGIATGLPMPAFGVLYRSTSISDAAGNLLLAFNGQTIIDRNMNIMPALANVNLNAEGGKTMIQQIPNTSKYYVFYIVNTGQPNSWDGKWILKYALVDLSINSGNGDVVTYNQVVDTCLSPSYTLAQGDDPSKAWLITHRWSTDSFFVHAITVTGLSTVPVVSRAGTNSDLSCYIFRDLKTSANGKMIAGIAFKTPVGFTNPPNLFTEVFNFDPNNGSVTYKVRTLDRVYYPSPYRSLEFSADNRLLYESFGSRVYQIQPCELGISVLTQYNLCYTDSVDFSGYSTVIAIDGRRCRPDETWGNIQMGADKRIHVPFSGTAVNTINFPNRIGSSSKFVVNSYQLPNTNYNYVVTPDFHHKLVEKAVKNNIVYNGHCYPNSTHFKITNDTITNIVWNFGDPASPSNTSTAINPAHLFSGPGIYTVSATLYNSQNTLIESISELVEIKDPGKRLLSDWPADTSICYGSQIKIGLSVVNGVFRWYPKGANGFSYSMISDSIGFSQNYSGTWYVEMRQNDCDGCTMLDSITINILPRPNFSFGPDRNLCQGDSTLLSITDPSASYTWSTGATTSSVWIKQPGVYWGQAEYNQNGCPFRDSILITQVPGFTFSLPGDTTLCKNNSLLLNPGVTNASYLWQDGSVQPQYLISQSGSYWVTITQNGGCAKSDTMNVAYYLVPVIDLGPDTHFCTGDSLQLQAGNGFVNYNWSTGSNASSIAVHQPGQYWVTGTTVDGCKTTDTLKVLSLYSLPLVNLGNDANICAGDSKILFAGNGFANYKWSNGAVTPSIAVTTPGIYWVSVTDQFGCKNSDSITIISSVPKPAGFLTADTSICSYSTINLKPVLPYNSYLWNTGATTSFISVTQPGIYWLEVNDSNLCRGRDTIKVSPKDCISGVYFPTAFTPNGDGKNDEFKPLVFGIVEKYNFTIINRYGQVVFYSDVPGKGWNGTFVAMPQDYNSFTWICHYKLRDQPEKTEKGSVVLIR